MKQNLTEFAIAIIVLGITATVGISVLLGMRNSQITTLPTYQVANESVTTTSWTSAGKTLAVQGCSGVTTVINGTDSAATGNVIDAGNYSVTVTGEHYCVLNNLTSFGTAAGDDTWYVTYSPYNVSDPRFSLPDKASIGIGEYGSWFKVLVIVVIAGIILGLIMNSFGRPSNSSGVEY